MEPLSASTTRKGKDGGEDEDTQLQTTNPFDLLPAECVVRILSFLHVQLRLVNASRVCQRWRALVMDFITEQDRAELRLHAVRAEGSKGLPMLSCPRGYQVTERGEESIYCALAHSRHGDIPGKAIPGSCCWYPYGGREYRTDEWSWIVGAARRVPSALCRRDLATGNPTHPALGHQLDGAGHEWVAIAHTQWGDIPGKAAGDTCWFPYKGREHITSNFDYVVPTCPW